MCLKISLEEKKIEKDYKVNLQDHSRTDCSFDGTGDHSMSFVSLGARSLLLRDRKPVTEVSFLSDG